MFYSPCTLNGEVQNLRRKCASSVLRASPLQANSGRIPAWYSCTCNVSHSPSYSCKRQAPGRSSMLRVALSREVYAAGLDPTAVGRWWQCWCLTQTCLPWYTAHRLCCSRAALVGGIRWIWLFFANSLRRASSISVTVLVLSWKSVYGIFINMIRCSGEKSECLVSSGRAVHTVHAAFCPCPKKQETVSQPVIASNIGSAYTLSQGPEPEQSHSLLRRGKTSPYFPIKTYPYFNFLLQGACQSHCQDNISVNCADEDFLVSSVGSMQHYTTVDLFVVARSQGWSTQKRWLSQAIISFSDDQLLVCKLEWVAEDAGEEAEQLCLVLIDSEEAG